MSDIFGEAASWLGNGANWGGDDGVPHRLVEHLGYTALTVGIAGAIALPLGLWIGHTGRLRSVAIALTGALRALPTLGVLTLMVLWRGIGLTPAIADTAVSLPPSFPSDPADRVIYATAIEHGWQLVTKDDRLRSHPHPRRLTLW